MAQSHSQSKMRVTLSRAAVRRADARCAGLQ